MAMDVKANLVLCDLGFCDPLENLRQIPAGYIGNIYPLDCTDFPNKEVIALTLMKIVKT